MDIVAIETPDARPPRDTGTYFTQYTGRLVWPDETTPGAAWQAQGLRLTLLDGRQVLTTCSLECAPADADDVAARVTAALTPWARTLRFLGTLRPLRHSLDAVQRLREEAYQWEGTDLVLAVADKIMPYATEEEAAAARATSDEDVVWSVALADLVIKRITSQVATTQRVALAYAPDVVDHPLSRVWEQPSLVRGLDGESTAKMVASELLTAWGQMRAIREPLITWAVMGAGMSRTAAQQTSGASRSTINRLLPDPGQ